MDTLIEVRNQIIQVLRTETAPTVKSVEAYGGQFSPEDLRRTAVASPALRLAIGSIGDIRSDGRGRRDFNIQFLLAVITGSAPHAPRADAALSLIQTLIDQMLFQCWELTPRVEIYPVDLDSIDARNLFDGDIDRMGVALWRLAWRQRIILPTLQ